MTPTAPTTSAPRLIPFMWLYGLFFVSWGILIPYFVLYLVEAGNSRRFATWVFSLFPLVAFFAPPIWGYLMDRVLNRRITLTVLLTVSGAVFLVFSRHPEGYWLIGGMLVFSLFATPVIPTLDAISLRNIRAQFATARAMGTLTFLITTLLGGAILEWVPLESLMFVIPVALWLTGIAVWFVDDTGADEDRAGSRVPLNIFRILASVRKQGLLLFFLFGMLYWISFIPYMHLFSVFLKEMLVRQGFDNVGLWIGIGWAISTLVEFFLFLVSNRLIRHFRLPTLFGAILFSSLLRYTIFALAAPIWLILAAQTLHSLGFALFYIVGTRLVASQAPPHMRNSYQTLWASLVIGLGGFTGGILTGAASDLLPIEHLYWLANTFVLLSAIPLILFLRHRQLDNERLITG